MSDLLVGSIIYASLTLLTLMLVLLSKRMTYWRKRGISHRTPNLIFGNLLESEGRRSLQNIFQDIYDIFHETLEPFCGFYWLIKPAVFILDRKLAFQLLTCDAENFLNYLPMTGETSMLLEMPETEILNAYIKPSCVFNEALGILSEKDVDMYAICKSYMESVLKNIFSKDGIRKEDIQIQTFTTKWSYIFAQINCKETLKSKSLRNRVNCSDIYAMILCCTLYELAKNPLIQQELYENITRSVWKNDFNYQSLKDIHSLKAQISATLSRYAPFSHVILHALKDYDTNRAGYNIEQGNLIIIPTKAMEDFSQCNQLTAAGFGNFGVSLLCLALAVILRDFKINTCTTTPYTIICQESFPYNTLQTTVNLKIEKR